MKQNLVRLAVSVAAIAVIIGGIAAGAIAGFTAGQAQGAATARGHRYCDETVLERLPSTLSITVMQMDQVRRISDRAKTQMTSIRDDAREKRRAVMDATISEISVLLTPEQQKRLGELQEARQQERSAREKLRHVLKSSPSIF
jgi:Spy/CpxP family protein refolding chaperone